MPERMKRKKVRRCLSASGKDLQRKELNILQQPTLHNLIYNACYLYPLQGRRALFYLILATVLSYNISNTFLGNHRDSYVIIIRPR